MLSSPPAVRSMRSGALVRVSAACSSAASLHGLWKEFGVCIRGAAVANRSGRRRCTAAQRAHSSGTSAQKSQHSCPPRGKTRQLAVEAGQSGGKGSRHVGRVDGVEWVRAHAQPAGVGEGGVHHT